MCFKNRKLNKICIKYKNIISLWFLIVNKILDKYIYSEFSSFQQATRYLHEDIKFALESRPFDIPFELFKLVYSRKSQENTQQIRARKRRQHVIRVFGQYNIKRAHGASQEGEKRKEVHRRPLCGSKGRKNVECGLPQNGNSQCSLTHFLFRKPHIGKILRIRNV